MKITIPTKFLYFLSFMLIIAVLILSFSLVNSDKEIKELSTNIKDLQIKYDSLSKDYKDLQGLYEKRSTNLETIRNEINDQENLINEKMKWFKLNANFKSVYQDKYDVVSSEALSRYGKCTINLVSVALVNQKKFYLEYKDDSLYSTTGDKLKDINEMFKNGGGDCEDFSQLVMAEYNSMVDECNKDRSNIEVKAMMPGSGDYIVGFNDWYYPGMIEKKLSNGENYLYVICYNVDSTKGHCVVGLFPKKINSDLDVDPSLRDIPLVEPQSGEYIGTIDATNLLPWVGVAKNEIIMIMTGDDIYYKNNEYKWISYKDFLDELEQQKEILSKA